MTSIRQTKKDNLKSGKSTLPTKAQKIQRTIKKITANIKSRDKKRAVKLNNIARNQAEIKKDHAAYTKEENRQKRINEAYANSPEGKIVIEHNNAIRNKLRKSRLNSKPTIEKTPKKQPKKLHDITNGVSFDFEGNENSNQTYAVHPLKNGGYVLQTNILSIPAVSKKQARDLRIAAGIETTRKRRNAINECLENLIVPKNKTDSLSIEMAFDKDYNVTNIQVGAYSQVTHRHFSNKSALENLIKNPNHDETSKQLNHIMDFCRGKIATYGDENQFLDYLKNQEAIQKDFKVPDVVMSSDEMITALGKIGYTYEYNEELTKNDFKNIQTNILKIDDKNIISPYKSAELNAPYAVQILDCITNELVTQFFDTPTLKGKKKTSIPHSSYSTNPKNNKPLNSNIAPITNPATDPRATLNAVLLRYFVQNEESLFSKTQMKHIEKALITSNYKWIAPASPKKEADKTAHIRLVS